MYIAHPNYYKKQTTLKVVIMFMWTYVVEGFMWIFSKREIIFINYFHSILQSPPLLIFISIPFPQYFIISVLKTIRRVKHKENILLRGQ